MQSPCHLYVKNLDVNESGRETALAQISILIRSHDTDIAVAEGKIVAIGSDSASTQPR